LAATPDADADPVDVARSVALRMLERQPRTRAELARALARRGVPDDAATEVLDRFVEVKLIDDEAFARAWVDSRHHGRGLARRALANELHRRGVAAEVAQQALSSVSTDDEVAVADALVERKLRSMSSLAREVKQRRLVGMLARKGFPVGLAARVVREALDHDQADQETDDT
jgi:regulatory protein